MVYAHLYSIIVIDESECPTKIKVHFKTINNVQNIMMTLGLRMFEIIYYSIITYNIMSVE